MIKTAHNIKLLGVNFDENFDIPRYNTLLYGKCSLRYLGPFLWNKLDKNITETSSVSTIGLSFILDVRI